MRKWPLKDQGLHTQNSIQLRTVSDLQAATLQTPYRPASTLRLPHTQKSRKQSVSVSVYNKCSSSSANQGSCYKVSNQSPKSLSSTFSSTRTITNHQRDRSTFSSACVSVSKRTSWYGELKKKKSLLHLCWCLYERLLQHKTLYKHYIMTRYNITLNISLYFCQKSISCDLRTPYSTSGGPVNCGLVYRQLCGLP